MRLIVMIDSLMTYLRFLDLLKVTLQQTLYRNIVREVINS